MVSEDDGIYLMEDRLNDFYIRVSGEGGEAGTGYAPDTTDLNLTLYDWEQQDPMGYSEIYDKGASLIYKIEQEIYSKGILLRKEYNKKGICTTDIDYYKLDATISKAGKQLSFKDAFLRYSELRDSLSVGFEADEIAKVQPLVVPAYYKLGKDRVKSLKYIKKAVEEAIRNINTDKSKEIRAAEYITKKIRTGFISSKSAKAIINETYQLYGINKTGKASDLDNWFNCKATNRRIDNKQVSGYEIYSPKIVFSSSNSDL